MSREAYQPPSSGTTNNAFSLNPQSYEDASRPVQYQCAECGFKLTLNRADPIRCKECGHRVLYKQRTTR